MGAPVTVSGGSTSSTCGTGGGSITADCEQLQALAAQVRLAGNLAATAAASVHSVPNLGDLLLAGTLDPGGELNFQAAVTHALVGPYGLDSLENEVSLLARHLARAAVDYGGVDGPLAATFGPLRVGLATIAEVGEGRGRIHALGPVADDAVPPRSLTDVMANLAALDRERQPGRGEIEVQILGGSSAGARPGVPTNGLGRKVIVYVPGTEQFLGSNATNLGADASAIEGLPTAYADGVVRAMRAAGVTNTDDVMIVGHSLGGLVGVNVARAGVSSGEFNITHVITAGAPIADIAGDVAPSTQVLAIETTGDPVPKLDGQANPPLRNVTTAIVHTDLPGWFTDHDVNASYLPATADVEASGSPEVSTFLAGADGYFRQSSAQAERFAITRA
jgi:hypothetical protein